MARSVPLGIVAVLGASLLVPATANFAAADVRATTTGGPVCPDVSTVDKVNAFLKQMDTATAAKAEAGYYLRIGVSQPGSESMTITVKNDVADHRVQEGYQLPGEPMWYFRTLENGYTYRLVTSETSRGDRAALQVLHRYGGWVVTRRAPTAPDDLSLSDSDPSTSPGTCVADEDGLTVTYTDETGDVRLRTDAGKALRRVTVDVKDSPTTLDAAVTLAPQTVPTIEPEHRIAASTWRRASDSATLRGSLRTWASAVAKKAKARAARADRAVKARDVQSAAAHTPLSRGLRSKIDGGALAVQKDRDPYTNKRLRIRVVVSEKKVQVSRNW